MSRKQARWIYEFVITYGKPLALDIWDREKVEEAIKQQARGKKGEAK